MYDFIPQLMIVILALFILTWEDLKTKQLSLWVLNALLLCGIINMIFNFNIPQIIMTAMVFIFNFALYKIGNYGSGDVILLVGMCLMLPISILMVMLIAGALAFITLCVLIIFKIKHDTMPFVPFLLIALISYLPFSFPL